MVGSAASVSAPNACHFDRSEPTPFLRVRFLRTRRLAQRRNLSLSSLVSGHIAIKSKTFALSTSSNDYVRLTISPQCSGWPVNLRSSCSILLLLLYCPNRAVSKAMVEFQGVVGQVAPTAH